MRILVWFLGSLLAISLASCGTYKETYNNDDGSRVKKFKTLSFASVRESVFRPQCFECHSNANAKLGGGHAFEDLADARRLLPEIISDLESDKMPKDRGALPESLKEIVRLWAKNNAPEDSNIPLPGTDEPTPPTARILVGFGQVRSKIFEPHCVRCHGFLSDPQKVVKNIDKILGSVDANNMPKFTSGLSPKLKKLLHQWVDDGMLMGSEEVIQKVLIPYCVRCHGSSFTKGESVSKQALHIWTAVMSDEMPKNGDPVPDDLKRLLDKWFKEGAAN